MSTLQRLRRGTNAQILDPSFMIGEAELVYATDTKIMYLGDSGGNKIPQVLGKDEDLAQLQRLYSGVGEVVTTGTVVSITTDGTYDYSQGRWFWFKADKTVLKPVGIKVNGGTALVARNSSGVEVDITKDKIYMVSYDGSGASFFQVASGVNVSETPTITGNIAWSNKYNGLTDEILDSDGNLINVNVGEYVYNEGGESKIVLSGSIIENPTFDTWDDTLSSPSGLINARVSAENDIYAIANSNTKLIKYDTLSDTWDETLTIPSATFSKLCYLDGAIYVRSLLTPFKIMKYTISNDTWDETFDPTGYLSGANDMYSDGVNIFLIPDSAPYSLIKFDIVSKTYDETLQVASALMSKGIFYEGNFYFVRTTSPYNIMSYNVLLDTWNEDYIPPSSNAIGQLSAYNNKIYASTSSRLWVYDLLLDTWDYTRSLSSVTLFSNYLTGVGSKMYAYANLSPYRFYKYDALENVDTEVSLVFPIASNALTSSELLSTATGVLKFKDGLTTNTRYTGFKSTKNLF